MYSLKAITFFRLTSAAADDSQRAWFTSADIFYSLNTWRLYQTMYTRVWNVLYFTREKHPFHYPHPSHAATKTRTKWERKECKYSYMFTNASNMDRSVRAYIACKVYSRSIG